MAPERKTLSELSAEYGIPLAYIKRRVEDETVRIALKYHMGTEFALQAARMALADIERWCKTRKRSSRRRRRAPDTRQLLMFE